MKHFLKKTVSVLTACLVAAGIILTGGALVRTASAADGAAVYSSGDLFSDRDLEQTADLSEAVTYQAADGTDIRITEAGVYVLTGTASEVTVRVEAGSDDKVQLVLDGLNLTNSSAPCIDVVSAGKVFVTTVGNSSLAVTGAFTADDKADGVIFSKDDLVLNGTAELTISSTDNGVVSKDDLKITGGTYSVTAASKAFEANDSIRIAGGAFVISAGTDGFHAENNDDSGKGYIWIGGGTVSVTCGDDALHATTVIQVDGGIIDLTAAEGLEATFIQINGGDISISASDDGINAAHKSSAVETAVEINGGTVNVVMGAGDTDGIDSNGNLYINGGVISVTGNSTFDYDGTVSFTGGTVYVNGQQTSTIPNQMMGGRGGWGNNGAWGNGQPFDGSQTAGDGSQEFGGGRGGHGGRFGW